jgi:hypothetical protein
MVNSYQTKYQTKPLIGPNLESIKPKCTGYIIDHIEGFRKLVSRLVLIALWC